MVKFCDQRILLSLVSLNCLQRQGNITFFPSLASRSLISAGVLCDAGYISTFGNKFVNITLNGETVLSGVRTDRLWYISDVPVIPAQPFDRPVTNATIPEITHYATVLANAQTDRVDFIGLH